MLNIVFGKPGNAYSKTRIVGSGAAVSGGGDVYKLKNLCSNGGFNGSVSPWGFNYDDNAVEEPASTAVVDYTEAKVGVSSAFVTFNSVVEWFSFNLASSTDSGADISQKTITLSTYIKTNSSNLAFVVSIKDVIYQTQIIAPTGGTWAKRSFSVAMPVLENSYKIFVGIYATSGVASEAYIDDFSVTANDVFEEFKDNSYVTFSPGWSLPGVVGASDKSKYLLFFENGSNVNIVSGIKSIEAAGNVVTRIDLLDVLPYVTAGGTRVAVLSPLNRYNSQEVFSVSSGILSCTVSTKIDEGYSSASVSILSSEIKKSSAISDLSLWRITIYDDYGEVFDGVVTAVEDSSGECSITASGFSYFLNTKKYAGYFESDPSSTTKSILLDILSSIPEINYAGAVVDRSSEISNAQSLLGGIGPMDFSTGEKSAKEAIDSVLELGAFDDSYDALFVQIYSCTTPVLRRIPRKVQSYSVDYFIDYNNVAQSDSSWTVDVSSVSTVKSGKFTGVSGGQAETAMVANIDNLVRYGIIEESISSGRVSEYELYLVMQNELHSSGIFGSIGSITVRGMVYRFASGLKTGAGQIRAGDIIMINGMMEESFNMMQSGGNGNIIIVGQTSYDCIRLENSITPYEHESTVEAMLNSIEIG